MLHSFRVCRAQYLLLIVIAVFALLSMLAGCGAKGDLFLPKKTEQQQQR